MLIECPLLAQSATRAERARPAQNSEVTLSPEFLRPGLPDEDEALQAVRQAMSDESEKCRSVPSPRAEGEFWMM